MKSAVHVLNVAARLGLYFRPIFSINTECVAHQINIVPVGRSLAQEDVAYIFQQNEK